MGLGPHLSGIPEQRAGFVSSPGGPSSSNGSSGSCRGPREEEPALRGAVELLPGRLLFAPLRQSKLDYLLAQGNRASLMAFCIDHELVSSSSSVSLLPPGNCHRTTRDVTLSIPREVSLCHQEDVTVPPKCSHAPRPMSPVSSCHQTCACMLCTLVRTLCRSP